MKKENGKNGKTKFPSITEKHGRDKRGRFIVGNKCATGNPFRETVYKLRSTLLNAITPEDIKSVVAMLIDKAKKGDVLAAKELLSRTIGKPADMLDAEKLVDRIIVRDDSQAIFAAAVIERQRGATITPELLAQTIDILDIKPENGRYAQNDRTL